MRPGGRWPRTLKHWHRNLLSQPQGTWAGEAHRAASATHEVTVVGMHVTVPLAHNDSASVADDFERSDFTQESMPRYCLTFLAALL